ncbi:hydroxymethylbilane synthase [Catalinimonas alkaloidigena]|uniref:hydroxymethylbilane synthase n=1 Tax=Catalinimonas alkaloidigena TaxID=1075417 RepID=UPI002406EC06|nr:hydroxymethylbilane synthase [Catalinimonas alkaloidigena]MDF9796224.1 hydroxymethylbilane synthase [Catalinimonas alkaloidigena]
MKLKIGTRGSKLALWQAYYVAEKLQQGGVETEIITIDTKGDKKLDVAIAEIGEKGVFTQEIEQQLLDGVIDIAVHSAKDMQSELPKEFELIAFTEREKVHDVLVSHQQVNLADKSREWLIGTSSARRKAMLKHYYPHVNTVEIRGNLQTRFTKMESGLCDAMLLAYAGVHRMNYHDKVVHEFDTEVFIPAVGQGSVAVEVLSAMENDKKSKIKKLVSHEQTEYRLLAERAFLKTLRGGCSIPVFALAKLERDALHLTGGVISLDGQELIKENVYGKADQAEKLGNQLALKILDNGGDVVLEKIKKQMNIC